MKQFIIAMFIGCLVGAVYAASVQTITIPASGASYLQGTWVNTLNPKRDVKLDSAFIEYASGSKCQATETNTVKVSKSGVTYTVDMGTSIATNTTTASVDFDKPAWCSYGETVTVTRVSASTGIVVNVMLVVD